MSRPGRFHIEDIQITELGDLIVAGTLVAHRLKEVVLHPREFFSFCMRAIQRVKSGGFQAIKLWLANRAQVQSIYDTWVATYDTLTNSDRQAIRAHVEQMEKKPLISIIMPVYNPPAQWLSRALDSVLSQLYPHWELCVVDDASSAVYVRKVLDHYRKKDARIRVIYRSKNGHISEASNDAIAMAKGEFLALLDHDDELSEHALYMVVSKLNRQPNLDIIYSDEDKIDENQVRYDPYFKPDWNPDLFFTQNCISHLGVFRASMVRAVGGFRKGYEGAQDWDLALRIIERSSADKIGHIPRILYHWRSIPGSTARGISEKNYARTAQEKMLKDHFLRQHVNAQVIPVLNGNHWQVKYEISSPLPLVSLLIPTRDGYEVLHRCIETIFEKTTYPNFEVMIVDNQSKDPKTLEYFDKLKRERGVHLLQFDKPFNFSAINNFAASMARGEILGFLNNDLEVISSDWLDNMVQNAVRPEIGAVGALLYFPDNTIQHAGVILGVGASRIAGHAYYLMPRGFHGQMGRAQLTQNLSAVTAACLVVQKSKFEEVSGFEEKLAIAFNDVDFCLRLRNKGYRNIWLPHATLYHHESASRGPEHTLEKQKRFERECAYMEKTWGQLLQNDPAYNPNLSVDDTFALAFPPRVVNPWI
jgi:GT2 family glycosyltransferase